MSTPQLPDRPSPEPAPEPGPERPVAPFTKSMFKLQNALGGRYAVLAELGQGGMGVVYLAREIALNRLVALKVLPPTMATTGRRDRFLREARIAARLEHDHIVPIHTVDEAGPFVYYTMPYIEGETLSQKIRREGPLPVGEATRILHDVARAVHYAHERGVIHRDLKPGNILLDEQGKAYVADFGLARVFTESPPPGAGQTFGTYLYMSPEQAAGLPTDCRSDVYSLGVLGYYLARGVPPFQGRMEEVLEQHIRTPAPPLGVFNRFKDTTLWQAVGRCLGKRPEDRYHTARELANDLLRAPELSDELPERLAHFVDRLKWITLGAIPAAVVAGIDLLGDLEVAVRTGQTGYALLALVGLALVVPSPVLLALPQVRKLARAGLGQAEIVHGINLDLDEQARRLGAGPKGGKLATVLTRVTAVAWTVSALGLAVAFIWSNVPEDLILVTAVGGAFIGLLAGAFKVIADWYRTRLHNERWLKFWSSDLGAWTVKLMGVGLRDQSLALQPEAAALPAPPAFPRLAEVLERSDSCLRRGQASLEAITAARAQAGGAATPERRAEVEALAAKLVALKAWRDRLESVDVASTDPGSLTRDIDAAWELCDVIDGLIEGWEV